MTPAQSALDAIGQLDDVEIDIAEAALQFARADLPDAEIAPIRGHLTEIARAAATASQERITAQAAALSDILGTQFGYRGDSETYDDIANANLIRVVQRRKGLPVTLGILWMHAARTAGWDAAGLNFPGHFLVGLGTGKNRVILDPFAGGNILTAAAMRALLANFEGPDANLRPDILAPVSDRDVLLRLQNNIKLRRLRAGDIPGARACNANMRRFAPNAAPLWRDEALLADRLEEPAASLAAWQRFLALAPDGEDAELAKTAIRELRSRLH